MQQKWLARFRHRPSQRRENRRTGSRRCRFPTGLLVRVRIFSTQLPSFRTFSLLTPDGGSPFGIYSPPAPTSLKTPSRPTSTTWCVYRIRLLIFSITLFIDPRVWTRWPDRQRPPCQRLSCATYPTRFSAVSSTHERHGNRGSPPCPVRYPTTIGPTSAGRPSNTPAWGSPTSSQCPSTSRSCPHRRPTSPRNAQWCRSSHAPWCATETSRWPRKIHS